MPPRGNAWRPFILWGVYSALLVVNTFVPPLIAMVGSAASAQDAGSDDEDSGGIDVIIVTAQKVAEDVQDVPIAIGVGTRWQNPRPF